MNGVTRLLFVTLLLPLSWSVVAQTAVDFPPAGGKPPPAAKEPKKNTNAGEDTSTLPDYGPTMRKNQQRLPPPPTTLTIMYKLEYGSTLSYTHPDGTVQNFEQWKSFPNDAYGLVAKVNATFDNGMNYQYATKPLASDGFDPVDIPLLYMTGDYAFTFTDSEVENLRRYILDGGTILFNAARGRDEFTRSVAQQMRRVFPSKKFMKLPPDHPLFHARSRLAQVSLTADGSRFMQPPEVYSLDIGTRAAAILMPWGGGAAWSNAKDYHPRGRHMIGESAKRLGVNVVAYTLGGTEYGRFLAQQFTTYSGTDPQLGDPLRLAVARYGGSYDLYPAIQNSAMPAIREKLPVTVDYAPVFVDLNSPTLGRYPMVFMTGHYDFEFTDAEVANLRSFLHRGGVLIASAASGLSPFDTAFKREIARVVPSQSLIKLPPTHPAFADGPTRIDRVRYTETAKADHPGLEQPEFYGLFIDSHLAVFYTPFDMMTGVNREPNVYAKGYADLDAEKLFVNLIAYCLTH